MSTGLWHRLRGEFPPHQVPFLPRPRPGAERTLALVLAYDGSAFKGWQVQPRGRTIQGELEKALGRLCDHPVRLQASGRTDTGVHAWGQVAHFQTTSTLECPRLLAGLRALAPPEVWVRELGQVAPDFHARYRARAKTYDYYLWPGARAPLFLRGRLWPLEQKLDREAVERALTLVVGEHDLRAFASRGAEVEGSSRRRILEAELQVEADGLWRIRLTATGFLRHVVRNLVGTFHQVGRRRLAPEAVAEMLAAGARLYPGPKAPPGGLYLNRVYYQDPAEPPAGGGQT